MGLEEFGFRPKSRPEEIVFKFRYFPKGQLNFGGWGEVTNLRNIE